ncbi:prepilin-type N-terminal cleavage/methylation domain-containing protein [Lacticaseibacillus pantheris]|uniref:prepilin-type N-terminal cleavage/methylation domain-containing protein n=1 Tax=Lacticaseibacillus pantheris TaxID=171523 RepID=UPI0009E7EFDB|nr:prepilin-type N-terminal cleavage/methylation domain-containing protein [Lacticaseibacillus pantheris]
MRRRPGFTMIEVLMVLVVVATLAVFTITVGQRWEQRRVEDAFFLSVCGLNGSMN